MSTEPVTFTNPVWGSPDPAPRRWGAREIAVAVGIAAVIAGLGGAAIYAATGESSPAIGRLGQHAFDGSGPPGGPGPGAMASTPAGPGFGSIGTAELPLHGQYVVADDSGGYTTTLTQTGIVTTASPTSITVRSEDGFIQTYLTSEIQGRSSFAVNDTVSVRAIQDGDVAKATGIVDPHAR